MGYISYSQYVLILYLLLDVFINVWEYVKNLLKDVYIKLQQHHFSLCNVVFFDVCFVYYAVMVDHVAGFKVPLFAVLDDAVHDEHYKFCRVTYFDYDVTFSKLINFKFFKIVAVEVVVSILQELMDRDSILVHELGHVRLQ
jgi:hypothetical protein